jgi:aromatic-L-amino-acid decarboxylase
MSDQFNQLLKDGCGLLLGREERHRAFSDVMQALETFLETGFKGPVINTETQSQIARLVQQLNFDEGKDTSSVIRFVTKSLQTFQLNTAHPCYFGVFNPQSSTMGIVAETIAAAFNPQLASSASSKFCIGIEDRLINYLGQLFEYKSDSIEGNFTSGATEANHTALLCALSSRIPNFSAQGIAGVKRAPIIYCTRETHHSIMRAARVCGLGTDAVALIGVDKNLQFDVTKLEEQIKQDLHEGRHPLFLVTTLGSTSAGVIDPIAALSLVAKKYDLWFHVDAAFGGAVCLLPEFSTLMKEVGQSDSIALDPHKWLSVPMGCGMYMSKHRGVLRQTFDVEGTSYMPLTTRDSDGTQPYRQSLQWSRRFMGLKLFMTLAVHGKAGYEAVLRHQIRMGQLLKEKLQSRSWVIENSTPLPVVCFTDASGKVVDIERFVSSVVNTGRAFITSTELSFQPKKVLRAGIPNFITQEEHLDELLAILDEVRTHEALAKF